MINWLGCLHYSILVFYEAVIALLYSAFYKMPNRKKKIKYLFLSLTVLAVMTMFRDRSVGNDTRNYIALFGSIASVQPIEYMKSSITEPAFIGYCWLLSRISDNPQILFIVSGAFIYISIGRFLFKYIDAPGMVCYALITFLRFDFFLSTIRQGIAVAILLWSFGYMKEKKTLQFLFISLIAVFFHYSSILFILTYFLLKSSTIQNFKINKWFFLKWVVGITFLMVFFPRILSALLKFFPKYSYYIGSALFDGEPRLALFLQALVGITIFGVSYIFSTEEERSEDQYNMFSFFSIVSISLTIIASNATALNRFGATYSLFPLAQYSVALSGKKAMFKMNHVILVILSLMLFYIYGFIIVAYKTPEWNSTYPFSFIW